MKAVRVRTRCGEVRICELPAGCDLPAWWMEMRAAGHVVGHRWAMPFDNIALADVVEMADPRLESENAQRETASQYVRQQQQGLGGDIVGRIVNAIDSGYRPPE